VAAALHFGMSDPDDAAETARLSELGEEARRYVDTSALLKVIFPEQESDAVTRMLSYDVRLLPAAAAHGLPTAAPA
jgi:hypothetical protein